MKHLFTRAAAAFLLLAVLISVLPAGAAAVDAISPVVTSYEIQSTAGNSLSSISRNSHVNLIIHFKDTTVTNTDVDNSSSNIDVTKLVDSFTGGSNYAVQVDITSTSGPLTYTVLLQDVVYSGQGQSLRMMVGYLNTTAAYQTIDLTITQAVIYVEPEVPEYDPGTPDTIPTPMLIFSRDEISEPVKAGESFEVTIHIQNLSNTILRSPVISYTPSESLMLAGGSSTFVLEDIGAKKQ